MKMKIASIATVASLLLYNGVPVTVHAADPAARGALGAELTKDSQKEIESTMTDILSQVIDKDFEGTVDNFSKTDRERIGKLSESTPGAMKNLVTELKRSWQNRYGSALNLESANIPYAITRASGDRSASVVLPTTGTLPGVTLSLVDEGSVTSAWKLDIPNVVSNAGLKVALETAVRDFNQSSPSWPADQKEAYRLLALRVFGAFNGTLSS